MVPVSFLYDMCRNNNECRVFFVHDCMCKKGQGAFLVAGKQAGRVLAGEKWPGRILVRRKAGKAQRPPKNA